MTGTKKTYTLELGLIFLKKISKNNSREWFAKNKKQYEQAHAELVLFADATLLEMNKHDSLETISGKKSLYRIYKDTRFSKEKIPYKNHFSGSFKRASKERRGGYYFHIEPNNTFVAGGFFSPNAADLLHIRKHISSEPKRLKKILNQTSFKNTFHELVGEEVKTAPRGFDVTDEAIELIRKKQFIVKHTFSNEEVLDKNFHITVSNTFKKMRPYLDYMSEILTSDLNGEEL
ncbi:DUF2461 domain-containing protein [uncultured Cytophaga sp.]|uniref:DUF2461 domain-containing protein n=1 Tax=uncultured Cytophaga sp. TaxID=160238 RepID=UPI0026232F88|nr:DUF2461 domain-containing protein [uncultured Cytophaga sp.]